MRCLLLIWLFCTAAGAEGGIQWYASWEGGLAQAYRSGKPILLIAAAPHCHNVSGIW